MKTKFSDKFNAAAKAAKVSPEKLAQSIRALLTPSKCRNTSGRLFTANILQAISCTA